ncbi:MAG: NPCBM/NEW2 domain-containing protein [Planctomycetia bacterium]|nr:NPCBM/NEW2 domain-containing protein [Planctomycetia bacterium]
MRLVPLLFAALAALPSFAQVSLIDNDGNSRKGREVLISPSGEITVQTDGEPFKARLDDVSEIVYENRPIASNAGWEVHLATANPRCRDILTGTLADATEDAKVRLLETDAGDVQFPIDFAYAVVKARCQVPVPEVAPAVDTVLWTSQNKLDRDKGMIARIGKDTLDLDSETFKAVRTYKIADVEAVHLAPLNKAVAPQGVAVIVSTRRGLRVTGRILEMDAKVCRVETTHQVKGKPWVLAVQSAQLASIQIMNGNLVYLSDMNPKLLDTWHDQVANVDAKPSEEQYLFLDRGVSRNAPISIGNRAYRKGIATRKHVEIELDLGGAYSRFTATVGLLDEVQATGYVDPRVRFQVKGDGKELWRSESMSTESAPAPVAISVKGVKTLTLVVETEDVLDSQMYAGWGDARVVK